MYPAFSLACSSAPSPGVEAQGSFCSWKGHSSSLAANSEQFTRGAGEGQVWGAAKQAVWRDEKKVALGVFQCHLTPLEAAVPTGGLK